MGLTIGSMIFFLDLCTKKDSFIEESMYFHNNEGGFVPDPWKQTFI